jgi:tetratricopeptide (TPR) repeat protein
MTRGLPFIIPLAAAALLLAMLAQPVRAGDAKAGAGVTQPVVMGDSGYAKRIQAGIMIKQGKVKQGLGQYARLVRRDPDNQDLRADYADALLGQKKLAQANKQLRLLVRMDPRNRRVWYLKGQYHIKANQPQAARDWFARLLKKDPNQPDYLNGYSQAMRMLGEMPQAMAAYRRSLLIKAGQPWVRRDMMQLSRARRAKLFNRISLVDQNRTVKFLRSETGIMGPVAPKLKAGLSWHYAEIQREAGAFTTPLTKVNQRLMASAEYQATPNLALGVSGGTVYQGPIVMSYGALLRYVEPESFRIELKSELDQPWDDPIGAAESQGLEDRFSLAGDITALKNWVFSYRLEWREYYLNQDEKYADRHIASASLGRILLTHPYLSVNYNFYYSQVNQTDDFTRQLLIGKETTHGLSLYLEGQLSSYLSAWVTAAFRRDEGRELTAYEGGLGIKWEILPGLTISPSYSYSNDSQSVGGGDSHTFILGTDFLL